MNSWTVVGILSTLVLYGCFQFAMLLERRCQEELVHVKQEVRLTLPEKCAHLYNVGRSEEWQECMGVGPK